MPSDTTPPHRRWKPTLRRSIRLFGDFRHEQDDPRRFYTSLAQDSVGHVGRHIDLDGATLLDVGGGPGYFRDAFRAAGATYFSLDADAGELSGLGEIAPGTVLGSGMQLPFRDDAVDVCYSSNVLEHVDDPWRMADEMMRITKPGGLVFISYTLWFGPWGGHETSPWHYFGGFRARRRYAKVHGHEPKNKFGESLFKVTVAQGRRWAVRQRAGDVVAFEPRYHPGWARWTVRIPLLRELTSWNLVIILRKQ